MAGGNFIGGKWVPARSGAHRRGARTRRPASSLDEVRVERRRRRRRRGRRGGRRVRRVVATTTPRAAVRDAAQGRRRDRGRPGRRCSDLEIRNVGKPRSIIDFEMDLTVDNWRFFAAGARFLEGRAAGEYLEEHTSFLRRDPLGVVASIAPWNYPLNMATWKVGPALAAGNTVVLKPSELTPLTALRLAEITADILPPGVFNVVTGQGETAGASLVTHPSVAMVSLTGDVATGKAIATRRGRLARSVCTSSSAARRR